MATVHQLRPATSPLLSKAQLAEHLGMSRRWIELKQRYGLPFVAATRCFPHNRYDLALVEAWLKGGEARKPASLAERVAVLEARIVELERRTG